MGDAGEVDVAEKEATDRRVYVLPIEQIERIRAYQTSNAISSEVEAVRRLLDIALQMRDTVPDLLKRLKSRFSEERDLRMLAKDILTVHPLVKSVQFEDGAVSFNFSPEDRGKIEKDGETYIGGGGSWDNWDLYPPKNTRVSRPKGDLDDDIPF